MTRHAFLLTTGACRPVWYRSGMRAMGRASRFTALVLSLVMANLAFVTSGYACTAHAMTGMSGMVTARVRSAPASTSSVPGSGMMQQGSSQDDRQQSSPCRFPWAPNGCESMAPCAPAVLAPSATLRQESVRVPLSVADRTVALLQTAPSAPETPPPRV